ncbi:hypothetical protein GVO57_14115 (plasmid) [Sphingomonas changnyeongensis]|uniref:Uncharacterized protein n=1 Tax=Sphingomonas changnyeongensis TaxID=2698679 RepID=A0A7Z2S6D4_9SPHN|nr:hypothetical protein [Sphingomonas changnyeongensis]QHL92025.1 hypothetical protein GVO57_14115 [Sphingomonas changnyeongensis]
MNRAAQAGVTYFAGMFAIGFVLGTLRVLLLVPAIGEWGATLTELPVMLAVSWLYCGWLTRWLDVPERLGPRLQMGAVALTLLWIAEILLGICLFGRHLPQQILAMARGPGLAGLAAQIIFATFPFVQSIIRARSEKASPPRG